MSNQSDEELIARLTSDEPRNMSVDEQTAQVHVYRKPHIVVLGAGASRAALPNGDIGNNPVPLMDDLVDTLGFAQVLKDNNIDYNNNFEQIYSNLWNNDKFSNVLTYMNQEILNYFEKLHLPLVPAVYDHLVLSLRENDYIASFNWDPFLMQAMMRNQPLIRGRGPKLLFLHGNVLAGYCPNDSMHGVFGYKCSKCSQLFERPDLLYPITEKQYDSNEMISNAWAVLKEQMSQAFMFTVFGYSAPVSDVAAIEILKNSWGASQSRNLEQIEIIDLKTPHKLSRAWDPFLFEGHYQIHRDFYTSWIAIHPRRTGEAYWNQYFDVKFLERNPIPVELGFEDLWRWYGPMIEAEKNASAQS